MFNQTEDYFTTTHLEDIISHFKTKDGDYLKRILALANLLFLHTKTEENTADKKNRLERTKRIDELLYAKLNRIFF